ncbi:hypothetical protein ASZ78_006375 [Callipepla squamata]|uniref:Homeobox domain-containing protein n=1 Tax=Callipepla squamata TaxID=9009 RepID=A0A226MIC0_CALSU|nr:hypothetical protein ASZ78_006375 [Callipepla squamata]
MLPSALYWDLVGSSALLNLPAAPGFGSLGKSFLIENLLRAGAPQSPAQLRPLPASPVPLKLCPAAAAEQISPSGGPYPTRASEYSRKEYGTSHLMQKKGEESVLPLLTQESNSKARRGILRRAVFSEDQRKALEKMFQKQKYISKTDRKKLAINLGLKESQVRNH